MSVPGPRFTYEDYKLLPEGKRYEIIEGDLLMTPAPSTRHQEILAEVLGRLRAHVKTHGLGRVLPSPVDVILSQENIVQPDIIFVAKERQAIVDPHGAVNGPPDLAVEILSPSTSSRDQIIKRKLYGKYGVREYWLVDPDARTVEVLTLAPSGLETWRVFPAGAALTSRVMSGLSVPVSELFPD